MDGGMALAPALKDLEEDYLLLTMIDETVPAGMPVVLWGNAETATLTYGKGFAATPSTLTALSGLFLPANPTSVLTLQGKDDVPGFYAFMGDIIEPNQAYLKLDNPDIQGLTLRFSDIEDGIRSMHNTQSPATGDIYDLSGRQMEKGKLLKGLYIVGGKKILVK